MLIVWILLWKYISALFRRTFICFKLFAIDCTFRFFDFVRTGSGSDTLDCSSREWIRTVLKVPSPGSNSERSIRARSFHWPRFECGMVLNGPICPMRFYMVQFFCSIYEHVICLSLCLSLEAHHFYRSTDYNCSTKFEQSSNCVA